MTYDYDPAGSIIHLRASGVLVASDPIDYFHALDKDPAFKPKAEERIYFTSLEDISFTYQDIVAIREAFETCRHGDKISHGLFIVDSDLSFGMARMVMAIFGDTFRDFSIERIG